MHVVQQVYLKNMAVQTLVRLIHFKLTIIPKETSDNYAATKDIIELKHKVLRGNPPQSYRASPAILDHTVLAVIRHR